MSKYIFIGTFPTNLFRTDGVRSAYFRDKFCRIKTDFNDVIKQSEDRCQREGSHKERDKSILNNCRQGNTHTYCT